MFMALLAESENVKAVVFVKSQQRIKRPQGVKANFFQLDCFYDILCKVTSSVSG